MPRARMHVRQPDDDHRRRGRLLHQSRPGLTICTVRSRRSPIVVTENIPPMRRHHDLMVEGVLSCAHDLRVRRRALLVASLPRVEKGGVGSGRELVQRLA
jgi:hypothetical protein